MMIPRVLTIAGSDSSGGAGLQADLKTIAAFGCYGMSAITAVTVQNTQGVFAIEEMSPELIQQQIQVVVNDIGVDVVKIGMLYSPESIEIVAEELQKLGDIPVILDPVMKATSGSSLIKNLAQEYLIEKLFPLSLLVTPNIAEAEALARMSITSDKDIEKACNKLAKLGPKNVLIKAGLQPNDHANDCFFSDGSITWFEQTPIDSQNTHGTGCTLSAAIASCLARGLSLSSAIREAKTLITDSLTQFADFSLGKGNGPVLPTILHLAYHDFQD